MKKYAFFFLALSFSLLAFSNNGEQSRVLVHTLNYISHDYKFAVVNGEIASKDEYEEAQEFGESAVKYFNEVSSGWSAQDSAEIRTLVYRIDSLIGKHAAFEIVSPLATSTKQKVIAASGLVIIPSAYPNLQNGKIVFKTECAKCHGEAGLGDGPEGKALKPLPRNFMDNERMKTISPFTAFNTIRLGVQGTGMKAHPELDDKEVWDVAFFITSLRYQSHSSQNVLKEEEAKKVLASVPLDKIAVSSDEDILAQLQITDTTEQKKTIATIRLNQLPTDKSEFIKVSLRYLSGAMELYQLGKYAEASQLAALSYLEGIEPIETHLKATDPALMARLEDQMQGLRKMMETKNSMVEVNDSLSAVRITITEVSQLLDKKQYSFWLALLLAASILLREGLEAFLVIMVILSVLKATELKNYKRWVHSGWIGAVLCGVVLWYFAGSILSTQMQYVELLEGIFSLIAVAMLLYVGFWLHSKSEIGKWKEYVNNLVKGAISDGSIAGLAGLSFLVVFREVFESVLFLSALHIEAGAKQGSAIVLGVIVAFVVVIALATVVLQFSTKLPIAKLFKISSFVMGVLAVVLAGKGAHSFQETGHLAVHSFPVMRIELLGIFPTVETCAVQIVIAALVALMWKLTIAKK